MICNCLDKLKAQHHEQEEKHQREENLRLQRKLQLERERREQLCRHLSESESSLEMDDERQELPHPSALPTLTLSVFSPSHCTPFPTYCSPPSFLSVCFNVLEINFRIYNEMTKIQDRVGRPRTVSSPIPVSPGGSRPLSPSTQTKLHHFPSHCFIVLLFIVTVLIFCVNARFPSSRLGCRRQSNQSDAIEFAIWSLCFLPVWHLSSRFAQLHARPCCRAHSTRKSRHWIATFRTRLVQPRKQHSCSSF